MTILRSEGAGEVSSGLYDFPIDTSLRFQPDGTTSVSVAADNPYLTTTLSGSGGTIWTFSCWVKLADLSTNRYLIQGYLNTSANYTHVYISNSDKIVVDSSRAGRKLLITTTSKLLDPNSWYNIVVKFNGTSGSTELKVYVNGVNQAYTTTTSFTAHQSFIAAPCAHYIGNSYNYVRDMAGYMAEVNLIDGTALDADSFGETKDGIWVPKNTSGLTFGDNGFRLEFKQTGTDGDANGIGADTSGSTNHFAVGDTDGLGASDVVLDSPTNNWCTLNPLSKGSGTITFSEGNLKSSTSANLAPSEHGATFTIPKSGKWYWEAAYTGALTNGGQATMMGIMDIDTQTVGQSGNHINNTTGEYVAYYSHNNGVYVSNTLNSYPSHISTQTSAVVGFALDMDGEHLWIHVNGTYINGTPDFSDGTNKIASPTKTKTFLPFFGASGGGAITWTANFGQDSAGISSSQSPDNGIGTFEYDVPAGYKALCSANLPSLAITDAAEHFTPYLYTANNASTRAFTGLGFQPDFLWFKARSETFSHRLFNSVVGVGTHAYADRTDRPAWDSLTSFDADGFSVETDGTAGNLLNYVSATYVAWAWKAGTAASGSESGNNPAFSSSSNADAGFSIVSYTGTGSAGTVSHGCGAKPTMIMIKNRSQDENWAVYHAGTASDPETDYMILNTTAGAADSANWWNDTAPTDSVFTVGTDHTVNADGENYIAYCFASVEGFSKAGSYTGGGSTFPFVYTGFRPSFVLLKSITAGNNWSMYDNKRDTDNPVREYLIPNENYAVASTDTMDFVSNGFKVRNAGAYINSATVKYVYLAFAEQPFKFANAR